MRDAITRDPVWSKETYEGAELIIKVPDVERVRLKTCQVPVISNHKNKTLSRRTQVELSCSDPLWKVNVPVEVSLEAPVATLIQSVARGGSLSEAEIELQPRNLLKLTQGYYRNLEALEGQVAKRALAPGTLITPYLLKPKKLIRKGDEVVILARTPNLQVRVAGEAMNDGLMGHQISVRNRQSDLLVRGRVVGLGVVEVGF